MARADTWMAFYPGAYLANTLHLSRAQHGSYFLLILAAFKGGGSIPNNDTTLATIARCTPKEWAAERDIFAAFFDVTDQWWTHERVTEELSKAERITDQRRAAGSASAARRQRPPNGRSNDRSTVVERQEQRPSGPSESQPHNPSHGETMTDAARASASPDGPPRSRLPHSAMWAERLAGYRPWEGVRKWETAWGPEPDSVGNFSLVPRTMLEPWKLMCAAKMAEARRAA